MAQINITPTRTKLNTTSQLTEDVCFIDTTGTEIANLEMVAADEYAIPIVIESLPSDIFPTITSAYTVDSPGGVGSTIQLTNVAAAVFTDNQIRVGDLIFAVNDTATIWSAADDPTQDTAGDEDFTAGQGNGFAVGAYISAFDSVGGTIDISVGAGDVLVDQTARVAGEIAFRRNGIKVTLANLAIRISSTGGNITVTPTLYVQDGNLAADGSSQDSYDGLTTADAPTNTPFATQTLAYDLFLTNARVARSNV